MSSTSLDVLPQHDGDSDQESGTEYMPSGEESINMEYDDITLDLVAPVTHDGIPQESTPMLASWITDSNDDLWKLPPPSQTQYQEVVMRKKDTSDVVISDEIITDYGRRSWCDYQLRESQLVDGEEEDVFVPGQRLSALIQARLESPPDYIAAAIAEDGDLHNQKKKWLFHRKCKACCYSCFLRITNACLVKNHPLPSKPTRCQRLHQGLLCPPHGTLAKQATLLLGVGLSWALAWALCGNPALVGKGGGIGSIFILIILGYIAGAISTAIKLPSYAGKC